MSFILDALKKSENERQRQLGPSLAGVHIGPRRGERPWWAAALVALLIVNLAVLGLVLVRGDDDGRPAPVVAAPAGASPPVDAQGPAAIDGQIPAAQSASPMPANDTPMAPIASPAVRPLDAEADLYEGYSPGEVDPALAAAAAVPAGPPLVRPAGVPESQASFPATSADNELLPNIHEVIAGGTPLPELHLDIHVYSQNPAERFVFVNLRKYIEGQTLAEGPLLERITHEGAVLNQRGRRFLLPRQ